MQIIIADDHPVILMGLKALLKTQGDAFQVVDEAHNGGELLRLLATKPCDLLITDFSMPDEQASTDGLPLLKRIRRDYAALPVIVLTIIHNPTLIRGMFSVGVQGVVEKAAFTKELLMAVRAVSGGRNYLSDGLREAQAEAHAPASNDVAPNTGAALSIREAEVVRLYASGLSVTQIAEKVHRSVKTISQQKSDAMRKLGLTSNSELYQYARTYGLIS
ncbi:response regulator transcription factor [Rhodanobacter sp. L36]|uniref:response regulator transcription factor n=1 Tax=Rhodanobacter sp. L36 TaxID=1747221 RepID=UPI0020B15EF8|nr:response regulator transcription factor [Rhodanobacter sp. L36]